ncbi:MAG: hypothetical protein ABEL76_04150, partial [Bradymonadaceae bacterium]
MPLPVAQTERSTRQEAVGLLHERGIVPVVADWPALLPPEKDLDWSADAVVSLLDALDGRELDDGSEIRWFCELVDLMAESVSDGRLGVELAGFVADALPELSLDDMRRKGGGRREYWRALIEHLPDDRVVFPGSYSRLGAAIGELYRSGALGAELLLFPDELRPPTWSEAESRELSVDVLRPLLVELGEWQRWMAKSDEVLTSARRLAGELMKMGDVGELLDAPEIAELPLCRVWSARESEYVSVSLETLTEAVGEGRAFGTGLKPQQTVRTIREARADGADVLLVDEESLADVVGAPDADLGGVAASLVESDWSVTSEADPRADL